MKTRSTKKPPPPTLDPHIIEMTVSPEDIRENNCVHIQVLDTGKIYCDQTGRFPVTSSRGNKYIMVLFHPETNAILAEPIKNRSTAGLIRAQTKIYQFLTSR